MDPPPPVAKHQPRLWVALAARLGSEPGSTPLVLRSGSGTLRLLDGAGRRWSAPQFTLQWQALALSEPLTLHRLVAGPFASFETAEHRAEQWRALGAAVTIARPGEWELWAPPGSAVPQGWSVRQLNQRLQRAVVPALMRPAQAPQPLAGPLLIEAPGGLRWNGGVYAGPFRLQRDAHGSWSLVEQVPLERYLEGVVPHEIGAAAPAAALAAQSVLARTWALRNQHRYQADGYHLCASVQCQVYGDPSLAGAAVRAAIRASSGMLLTWQDQPIHAVYHASNGGVAAPLEEAWEASPLAYLKPGWDSSPPAPNLTPLAAPVASLGAVLQSQAFVGHDHPRFRWSRWLSSQQLAESLAQQGLSVGAVQRLRVLERGLSGRVLALAIEGSTGRAVLRRDSIRRTLRSLPSTLFELRQQGVGRWQLLGGGFGHGVGLSQAGAIDLGRRGWSFRRILERYYPGTQLQSWQQLAASRLGGDP